MAVGGLYDTSNVLVGQAVLYVAPPFTPLPADSSALFDPTNWTGKVLTIGGATSITLAITTNTGTVTGTAFTVSTTTTAAAVKAYIEAFANVGAGKTSVTGNAGGPFTILFDTVLGSVTVAISTSTGGSPTVVSNLWLGAGGTEQGWTYAASKTTQDITIEEQSTPVGTFITSQQVNITGTMSEDVMLSYQWALNALRTVTAQATGQPGKMELNLSDNIVHYAVALEMVNKFGLPRRLYIPDTVSVENVSVAFRRAASQRLIPAGWRSVCQTSLIKIQEIISPAL